jgi:hypothetical protein
MEGNLMIEASDTRVLGKNISDKLCYDEASLSSNLQIVLDKVNLQGVLSKISVRFSAVFQMQWMCQ